MPTMDEKGMLLRAAPDIYFETEHYRGWPSLPVRLGRIGDDELRRRPETAWLRQAPRKLVEAWNAGPQGRGRSWRIYNSAGACRVASSVASSGSSMRLAASRGESQARCRVLRSRQSVRSSVTASR